MTAINALCPTLPYGSGNIITENKMRIAARLAVCFHGSDLEILVIDQSRSLKWYHLATLVRFSISIL